MSDKALFYAVCALLTLSLILSYSLSTFTVYYYGYSDFHFLGRQLLSVLLGIGIMVGLSWLDPDRWFARVGFALFFISLLAMISMPYLPPSFTKEVLGAKRWIHFGGFSIAPVEFFKVGFVFFISWSFSRKLIHHGKLSLIREFILLLPYMAIFGVAVFLIAIFQKDLGQVAVLAATMLFLTMMAGRSLKFFFTSILLGIFGVVALILAAPHRMRRIKSWWSTVQDHFLGFFPQDMVQKLRVPEVSEPYQISNSFNAIHNGGLLGEGLGNGQFKLGYLSEVHTDFVLSGLTEELGLFTLVLVIALVIYIIFRLLRIASRLHEPAYYLFTVGVALLILFAFVVNSFGISGMTPIKGIAVPFLSYGGSQIIASSIAIGMVLMLSKKSS